MKNLIFFVLLVTLTFSCKEKCTSDEFVGTYVGDRICNVGGSDLEGDMVIVSAGIDDDEIRVEFYGETLIGKIKNCDKIKVEDQQVLGTGLDGDVEIVGDQITVNFKYEGLGVTAEECEFVGTRQ